MAFIQQEKEDSSGFLIKLIDSPRHVDFFSEVRFVFVALLALTNLEKGTGI
jgi:translation elongation factor EF-G